jgi:uncharacterized protein
MNELPPLLFDGPRNAAATFAFAHGAGVGMESDFMNHIAQGLAKGGVRVARFEFPYMQKCRADGKRRPPDRAPILLETWRTVIGELSNSNLYIGGKSMGGRLASMIAAEIEAEASPINGILCLGYPFHPPGKPEKLRTEHLANLKTPSLILQGTRDPFGTQEEVPGYTLSKKITLHWMVDGEHSFKPRKKSGRSLEQNWDEAIVAMVEFMSH